MEDFRTVYVLYLDESVAPDLLALGGVAIRLTEWPQLRRRWTGCVAETAGRRYEEFKWSETEVRGWRRQLPFALIDVLRTTGATCFVTLISRAEAAAQAPDLFGSDADAYASALMFIVERYQRFLTQMDAMGLVVIDQRARNQDEALRTFFGRLRADGTPYTSLERIVEPLLLSPSHHAIGIQAADLVVGPAVAMSRASDAEIGEDRRRLARSLHERLLPCFARNPANGEVEGVGVKRFPDDRARADRLFSLERDTALDE